MVFQSLVAQVFPALLFVLHEWFLNVASGATGTVFVQTYEDASVCSMCTYVF